MKRIFFLLAIFVSACSPNTTAPSIAPNRPFPRTFKQYSVSVLNIPDVHTSIGNPYDVDNSGRMSFQMTFNIDSIQWSGDTLQTTYLWLVLDSALSSISSFSIRASGPAVEYPFEGAQYDVWLQDAKYTLDTLEQAVVSLSGESLHESMQSISIISGPIWLGPHGQDEVFLWDTSTGVITDSSSVMIRFIP
jgi:hypothetical protein